MLTDAQIAARLAARTSRALTTQDYLDWLSGSPGPFKAAVCDLLGPAAYSTADTCNRLDQVLILALSTADERAAAPAFGALAQGIARQHAII